MRSLLKNKIIVYFPTKVGKYCFLVFVLMMIKTSKAQNLVPNSSFEYTTKTHCSGGFLNIEITNASPWEATFPMGGSSDRFDTNICINCINSNTWICVFASKQKPRTGMGMAGIYLHDGTDTSDIYRYKEYIQVKLKQKLDAGQRYWTSYYVSLSDSSRYGINKIQAYFSDTLVMYENWSGTGWPNLYVFHPQVSNPDYNIITDTVNWVKIEGSFIANGNERFLVLGNFTPTYETHTTIVNENSQEMSYYFFDDIAVYPDNTPVYLANIGSDTCIFAGDTLTLGSPSRAEYLYQWYDGNGNLLDTAGSIIVCPAQTTTYILVQKDFRFEETRDTIKVTVGNCIPIPDYSHFEFQIYPNPCNGIVNVRFNTKVPDGAVLQLYSMIGQKVSEYPLTGIENIATVDLGNLATAIYHATVVVPDGFRKSVKLVVMR